MKRTAIWLAAGLAGVVMCGMASAAIFYGQDPPGNPAPQFPHWPGGLGDLLTRGGRTYGSSFGWLGGEQYCYYFRGDTDDFNWFLGKYAKLQGVSRTLTLHAGQGETLDIMNKQPLGQHDWRVAITESAGFGGSETKTEVSLDLWVGGEVTLAALEVPETMELFAAGQEKEYDEIRKFIKELGAKRERGDRKESPQPSTARGATAFISGRVLFAKVALTEDGSKVLSIALDESKGTRSGYDLLYADTNLNGKFEESERVSAASVRKHGEWLASSSFPPLAVKIPYNEKGKGIENPCRISVGYSQYPRYGVAEEIPVEARFRLSDDGAKEWECAFKGAAKPSKRLETAEVWRSKDRPALALDLRPDGYKKGNLGVGLTLNAGDNKIDCWKNGERVKVHVRIENPQDEVLHEGDATVDRFTFG
jgi:hypothetical protein